MMLDVNLMLTFILVPLVAGFLFIRRAMPISILCSVILIVDAAYLASDPYLLAQYEYSSGAWQTLTVALPFHPLTEIFLVILGVLILLLAGLQRGS